VGERRAGGLGGAVAAARRRWRPLDRGWLAYLRYQEVSGPRLAAASAYYGFFAVFGLALVAYAVLGYLLEYDLDVHVAVDGFLAQNLPWLEPAAIRGSRQRVGLVGLAGLVITGVTWIEAIRSAQRLIFGVTEQPGHPVVRWLLDLGVLVALLVLLGASLVGAYALEWVLAWLSGGPSPLLTAVSWALAVVVNLILAAALLGGVPRLRLPARRLRWPVLLVGIGLTLVNSVGQALVALVRGNAAYSVVAGAVGVLIYLYVVNQLLLFGAAVAATSAHGEVVDLGTWRRRRPDPH